jgi:hypothetical protein
MSKADQIRALAANGMEKADIARELGIRYQHVYQVLKRSDALPRISPAAKKPPPQEKPPLTIDILINAGFVHSGTWKAGSNGAIDIDRPLPKDVGVYAFSKDGRVLYVGVATMGLAKRIYFYKKPGVTQRTSLRINALLCSELATCAAIEIHTAVPEDQHWNGLPVHGSAGLELGLIRKFSLPWNMRSAR